MADEIRDRIENLVGEYCDGTFQDGLRYAHFIEYFGENSERGPQELANRLVKLFEELQNDHSARDR